MSGGADAAVRLAPETISRPSPRLTAIVADSIDLARAILTRLYARKDERLVHEARSVHEGVLIVYESLSGVTSGTGIKWTGKDYEITYFPEIDDWAKSLLGKVLGSKPA